MITSIIQIAPVVMGVIEIIKRFIPDKHRTYANPILAFGIALLFAYTSGGTEGILETLSVGFGAGVSAMVGYKVPKAIGARLKIK